MKWLSGEKRDDDFEIFGVGRRVDPDDGIDYG